MHEGADRQTTWDVVELELLKLVRHLETFGRKSSLYQEVDRAGYLALRTLDGSDRAASTASPRSSISTPPR